MSESMSSSMFQGVPEPTGLFQAVLKIWKFSEYSEVFQNKGGVLKTAGGESLF
jgi:hypothetical protein